MEIDGRTGSRPRRMPEVIAAVSNAENGSWDDCAREDAVNRELMGGSSGWTCVGDDRGMGCRSGGRPEGS